LANQGSNKITKYRRPLNLNIGMIIFAVIFVYIVICVFMYFTSRHIIWYEVTAGTLSTNNIYKAVALRDETVVLATDAGYANYFAREGSKVAVGDLVYAVDETGKLSDYIAADSVGENTLSDADLNDLKTEIVSFAHSFDSASFSSVYDFKYDLEGTVLKMANISMYEHMETLNQSSLGGMVSLCSAGKTGYVVYSTDGYEGLTPEQITPEMFDQSKYEKSRVNNNDLIEKNATVGKLVTDENWSLIIPVEKDRSAVLEEEEYVKVKFVKTQETSWGQVTIHHLADGDYAQLTFNNSCVAFCTDRYVDIELILDEVKGLKIPQSAIVDKEFYIIPAEYMTKGGPNGNYGVLKEKADENGNLVSSFIETTVYSSDDKEFYIDSIDIKVGDYICKPDSPDKMAVSRSGKLTGVYNMNKGYADFKQITKLDENEEYAIVSSNTKYGLTVYDRIVLDASSVKNYDFTYK